MKIISMILVYVLGVASALSATYYVDKSAGDNSNDGLSETSAWQTMSKVESYSSSPGFSAGDQILFKRGQTHSDKINFQSSGTSSSPITIGAYGTGSDPILASVHSVPAGTWNRNGNRKWRMDNVLTDPTRLWLSGVEYVEADASASDPVSLLDTQYRWYYDDTNNKLYVYAQKDPSTEYTDISGLQAKDSVLQFIDVSHIVVQDLDIAGGYTSAILLMDAAHDITIKNCKVRRCKTGILVQGYDSSSNPAACYNIVIKDNVIYSEANYSYNYEYTNIRDGIYFRSGVTDSVISGNTIKNWGRAGINLYADSGSGIKRVKVSENEISAANVSYCRGILFDSVYGLSEDNEFVDNDILNTTAASEFSCNDMIFYGNLINNVSNSAAYSSATRGTGQGMIVYNDNSFTGGTNNVIINNTITNCDDVGIKLSSLSSSSPAEQNSILSNTATSCGLSIQGTGYSHLSGVAFEVTESTSGMIQTNIIAKNKFSDTLGNDVYYKGTGYSASGFNQEDGDDANFIYGNN